MNITTKGTTEISRLYQLFDEKLSEKQKENESSLQLKVKKFKKQIKKLENLNMAKDRLLTIISHDLKNSFSALLGTSQILIEDYSTMNEDERLFLTKEINKASRNSYNLLENLLNWTRSQKKDLNANFQILNLREITEECAEMQLFAAVRKNIEIVNNIPPETSIHSDKLMLSAIIRNLLNNAVKFTGKGGRVCLKIAEHNEIFEFIIEDTGTGMTREVIGQILGNRNSYFTTSGTDGESGSGLGLQMCKELLEKMNGEMTIDSKPNLGSKFVLRFPKNRS